MMRSCRPLLRWLLLGTSVSCLLLPGWSAQAADTTTLYAPALKAQRPGLGFSVAAIVGLQVWQTLRQSDGKSAADFGSGLVVWNPRPLDLTSHQSAEKSARAANVLAQLVLWGAAYEYGDSVVAQFSLSLPAYNDFRTQRPEVWTIDTGDGMPRITADLPQRRYAFEPVVLDKKIVEAFSNPTGLPVFAAPNGGATVGRLGGEFRAIQSDMSAVLVDTGKLKGWVRLDQISRDRSEVVDFVSALVRVFRADWDGARDYLGRVLENSSTPTALLTDAHLLRAMVASRIGPSDGYVEKDLAAAAELSPDARRVVIYRAMVRISDAARTGGCERAALRKNIAQLLEEKRYVFPPDDPWLLQWQALAEAWGKACKD